MESNTPFSKILAFPQAISYNSQLNETFEMQLHDFQRLYSSK
jgi:hypothetical protein